MSNSIISKKKVLPVGWKFVPMSYVVSETQYGTSDKANNDSNGLPVLRMNNITYSGNIDLTSLKWCPIAKKDEDKYTVQRGDLLFNRTNSPELVGKTGVWERDDKYAFAGYLVRVRFKTNLALPKYISTYLNSPQGKTYLFNKAKPSSNMSNFSASEFLKIPIPLPPLEEQRRIAAILDKADEVRRKRKKAIALTEELLRSLFLDMFGDPVTNPKGWVTQQLKSLVNKTRGISYGIVQRGAEVSDGVPVIRISNIVTNKFVGTEFVRTAPEIAAKYQRTFLQGGELLVSIRGTVGRVAIAPIEAKGWNVSREIAVIPINSDISVNYLHNLLLSDGAQNYMNCEVRGIAQRGINLRELSLLPIPLPPREKQQRWDKLVSISHQLISQIENQFSTADNLFNSLLQKAFRGEL